MLKRSLAPRGAFTLIEMLVVIGIIALIAGIALPVFSRVRQGGYRTTCTSNLKQLGLAFQQYTQDYGGRYPRAGQLQAWANGGHWVTGGKSDTPTNFGNPGCSDDDCKGLADPSSFAYVEGHSAYPQNSKSALYSYIKSPIIFQCPAAPDVVKKGLSYSMNCALSLATITRVRNPGELVLLVDEGDTINDGFFWATKRKDYGTSTDALFKGHLGEGNLLFADGHVKAYNASSFVLDSSDAGLANKWRGSGSPRFHDRALGPNGSNVLPPAKKPDGTYAFPVEDACLAKLSEVRNWGDPKEQ